MLEIIDVRPIFLLLFTPLASFAEGQPSPLRLGVDIYNSVGNTQRLVSFMKIGASHQDFRFLNSLKARAGAKPLPKAFLAGHLIYFKDIEEPLKVVDLKQKIFSLNGALIDFRTNTSLELRFRQIERALYARKGFSKIWDFIFPFAVAATNDPLKLSQISGIMAVSGVVSSAHCLGLTQNSECTSQFMGTLTALGAVGGLRRENPATHVFCSPDFRGGAKFIVAGQTRSVLSVSKLHGEIEIAPSNLQTGTPISERAAAELLSSCRAKQTLANWNTALAYPSTIELSESALQRAPAAAQPSVRPYVIESVQSGTAR